MNTELRDIARSFQIPGDYVEAIPYGSGHINRTYAATFNQGGRAVRYILQQINKHVFRDPVSLMNNVHRVTTHMQNKLEERGDSEISRKTLTIIPARDGQPLYQDRDGEFWRAYIFIENAHSFDAIQTEQQAHTAAATFGAFQNMLTDLPGPRLVETIPDFHNAGKRFATLQDAIEQDSSNRAAQAKKEIDFFLEHGDLTEVLPPLQERGAIPERITHNDTKLNNVLIDIETGEGYCVIDLDTVMPGLVLYDFGDLVRTATSPAEEDERDLSKVHMQMPMFEQLVKGYLAAAGEFLTNAEIDHLVFSGKLITFVIGVRFLTDYLSGDVYFKVHREGHNLDRCRTQMKLVQSIEEQEDEMRNLVQAQKETLGA